MKKYYVVWYNHIANETQICHILANSESDAKEAALYEMKRLGGERYTIDDIKSIIYVEDDDYITIDQTKSMYLKTHAKRSETPSSKENTENKCRCLICGRIITDGKIFEKNDDPSKGICFNCY